MEVDELTYIIINMFKDWKYEKCKKMSEEVLNNYGKQIDKFAELNYDIQDKVINALICIRHE